MVPGGAVRFCILSSNKGVGRLSQRQAEGVVLATWPIHEADLIVSLFTREYGKVKGVAKSALKSRKRFGGALEPMTYVRASFTDKPRQELVRLDGFEVIQSPLRRPVDYTRAAALAFYGEVLEQSLQEHDPQETIFRLLIAVLEHTTIEQPWLPSIYFALWVLRLMGWLPGWQGCVVCGRPLEAEAVWWHFLHDGLFCNDHRESNSSHMSSDSWLLAQRILRTPLPALMSELWPRHRATDLRRFVTQALERHLERKLSSSVALTHLGG
jgi:DNA repair protein RecO (recombination protein O)